MGRKYKQDEINDILGDLGNVTQDNYVAPTVKSNVAPAMAVVAQQPRTVQPTVTMNTQSIPQTPSTVQPKKEKTSILKTLGNVATNMGTGALKGMEGAADTISDLVVNPYERYSNYVIDLVTKGKKTADENLKDLKKMQERDIKRNLTKEFQDTVGYTKTLPEWEKGSLVKSNNFGGQVAQGVGGMVPALLFGSVAGTAPELVNTTNLAGKEKLIASLGNVGRTYASQLPSNLMLGASSYGGGLEEALNQGYDINKARQYGLANAAIEQGTEYLTGGIPGLSGKGGIDNYLEPLIDKSSKGYANDLLKYLYRAGGEGLEETAGTYLDALAQKGILGKDIDWNETNKEALQSGLVGAATGAVLDSGQLVGDLGSTRAEKISNSEKSKKYNDQLKDVEIKDNTPKQSSEPTGPIVNKINDVLQNVQGANEGEEFKGLIKTPTYNEIVSSEKQAQNDYLNSTLEGLKSTQNTQTETERPITQETQNKVQMGNETLNSIPSESKIKNFRDSMQREGINDAEGFYKSVEKIIQDKDYNVIMDSSIKNADGSPVNALINNENGITIKINPKSDRAGEILLMHEVTHGIETKEMSDLIMNYASKNSEFNEALEDLKKTYGTQDVTPEVVADISGQLFGNQEFISNLSVEKPSVFRKIYDKIIEIANKITGNSKEALFIRDLKNKWEKAYRESTVETSQQNLKDTVKYSQNATVTDNKGRKLSEKQQNRFKNSKARDENGNLITVYHNTSEKGRPFYTFNPVGRNGYRYGNQVVNFYTDDPVMAGSYSDGDFEKVDTSKNADTKKRAKWQYEGYVDIKNPYIVDAKGRMYHNAVVEFTDKMNKAFEEVEKHKDELTELAKESERRFKEQQQKSTMDTSVVKNLMENLDMDYDYIDGIMNNNIEDYRDFYNNAKKEGIDLPSPDTKIEDIMSDWNVIEELNEEYDNRANKFLNYTVEEFVEKYNDIKETLKSESSWFEKKYKKIIGDVEQADDFSGSAWYKIAKEMFTQEAKEKNAPMKYQYNTNDIVTYILNENAKKLQNDKYDGVIFKNIIDTSDIFNISKYKPSTVYVTFNSNQFKSFDNLNPTDDPDIRYSKDAKKWQDFLDKYFKSRGTTTNLREKTGKQSKPTKLKESNGKYTRQDVVERAEEIRKKFDNQTLTNKKGKKVSNFYSNITEKSQFIEPETREKLKTEEDIKFYKEVTNEQALNGAVDRIGTTPSSQSKALHEFLNKQDQFTATDMAEGWVFLKQYQDAKNYDAMAQVAKKMREIGTKSGQVIQMLSLEARLTPEGMYRFAVNELAEAEQKFNSEKGRKKSDIERYKDNFQLTPEETEFIKTQMEKVQGMEPGRERDIEVAKINKMLQDKLPHTRGRSLKAWMRISMLFNPKTQVRNVMGNALITPINALADVAAGFADKAVSKTTGARTIGGPSLGGLAAYGKGAIKGFKQATQDYKLGLDTKNINQNRFDIGQGKAFNEQHKGPFKNTRNAVAKGLNNINDLLGYVMDAGDRMFYQGSVENSLYNQQRLNNTQDVTQEMADIAVNEGLQRTWNDDNQFTKAVLNIRRAINDIGGLMHIKVGEYGLGDLMIPFAKTPANLTKAIVDYSPVGFLNAITEGKDLKRAIATGNYTMQQQHDFSQTVGKAFAGSLLYILGTALAKAKISSGSGDEDKDLKNFMRYNLGIQPYSIKIGDKSFTYDWAQPVAAPLAITADIEKGIDENMTPAQALQQFLTTGFNVLSEQSFLSGVNEVLNNNDGILQGIEQQVMNMPATAVPTLLKQFTDIVDPTKRQTYSKEGMAEQTKKYAMSKIPSESKKLAPQVDVLGNEIQKYGGDNSAFNIFLNPANTEKGKSSDVSKEIYALYEATGNKNIIPKKVDYSITIDGEKKVLTTEEMARWQKASGKYVTENVRKAINDDDYKKLSDEQKSSVINGIVNYSYMKAKSDVFGAKISSYYSGPSNAEKKGIPMYDYYISKVKKG